MKQLENLDLENVVVIDIETVRYVDEIDIDSPMGEAWEYKMRNDTEFKKQGVDDVALLPKIFKDKAALFSEFAKIVCITVGRISASGEVITVKSYASHNEYQLLQEFNSDLEKVVSKRPKTCLAGHAIIGFDIPMIFRRSIVNGIKPTSLVDVGGLKPWEVTHIDTMQLWKGTGYNNASLLSLCAAFDIPSPKSNMDGANVGDVYWGGGDLESIVYYCEGDVVATANVLLKMMLKDTAIEVVRVETVQVIPEPLMTRIMEGGIDNTVEREILSLTAGFTVEEKEQAVEVINAALAFSKITIDDKLKAKILK